MEVERMWSKKKQMLSPKQVQDIWDLEARGLAAVDRDKALRIISRVERVSNTQDSDSESILMQWKQASSGDESSNAVTPFTYKVFLSSFSTSNFSNPFKGVKVVGDEKLNKKLRVAVLEGLYPSQVRELLLKGANPNHTEKDSLLYDALKWDAYNVEIIEMLLQAGADQNYIHTSYSCHGGTSTSCFGKAFRIANRHDDEALLGLFLRNGADPNKKDTSTFGGMRTDGSQSHYPLNEAVESGQLGITRALLLAGANPNCLKTLVVHNEYGHHENTRMLAIHDACKLAGNTAVEMVKTLLQFGANINVKLVGPSDALTAPSSGDDPRSGNYKSGLVHHKCKALPLHLAIQGKNAGLVHLLAIAGANTNIPFIEESTSTTVVELCNNNLDLLSALACSFQPMHFKTLPSELQSQIRCFLLCNERNEWRLPKEIRYEIFTWCVYYHWNGVAASP